MPVRAKSYGAFELRWRGASALQRWKRFDSDGDRSTGREQIAKQRCINVGDAFVLGPIPQLVCLVQDSPDLRPHSKRVG